MKTGALTTGPLFYQQSEQLLNAIIHVKTPKLS
jgi:hypothetical protein